MPIPSDYPGMTADQLDGYIADFLTAIYGEEVRDKFARIAYLIGHQIPAEAEEVVDNAKESATAASLAAEEASDHAAAAKKSEVAAQQYMTTASEHVVKAGEYRTEAADSAAESQTNADQAYNWNQNCLTLYHQTQNLTNQVESYVEQILGVGYRIKIITESEYENLDTGFDPNTLYIVLESTYNPLDSLVSYYPLTSDLTDYLNNAKVGQAIGCLGFGDWDHSGSSFYMKRTDSVPTATKRENYISLPNDFLEGINFSNGATFVIRCKPDKAVSAGNGDWTRIFNFYKHASSAPNDGEGEVYLTQGLIGTWYYNAQSVQYLDTSVAGTLAANQWHTVALVIEPIKPDNAHVKVSVFVDYRTIGSTQGVFTGTDWLNKVDQNWIGASRFDDDDFTGMVKDFRVYNKALSDSELTNVMGSQNLTWRLRWNGGQDETFRELDQKIQDILDGTTNLPYLKTSGGTMEGPVDMDSHAITGLPNPVNGTDAIPKGWADGQYSPLTAAIRPTVTGNPIHIEDSAEAPVQGLCVYGKTEQATTTGAQMLDIDTCVIGGLSGTGAEYTAQDGIRTSYLSAEPDTAYTLSGVGDGYTVYIYEYDADQAFIQRTNVTQLTTTGTTKYLKLLFNTSPNADITEEQFTAFKALPIILNTGSTAVPWEPYTGGKPSPSPEYPQELMSAEDVSVTLSDGGDGSQTLTLTGDLPGIPVDSGGNYTDPDGQQWVCNYRDWARGVDVQMVAQETLSRVPAFVETEDVPGRFIWNNALTMTYKRGGYKSLTNFGQWNYWSNPGTNISVAISVKHILFSPAETMTADEVNTLFATMIASDTPPTILGQLETPIETPIPAEELAAYKALQTYDGTTNVTATDGAGLSLRYVADTQKYIDNKITALQQQLAETQNALLEG